MDTTQTQRPPQSKELDGRIKYPLYLLLLCVAGCGIYTVHLPDMIEGRGLLSKILLGVPEQIWIIVGAILQIYFMSGVRKRTRDVSPSMSNLWLGLIVLTAIDCIVNLIDSENWLIYTITIIGGLAVLFIWIALAVRLRKSMTKQFARLGKVMIWAPVVVAIVLAIFIAMMPEDFGEIQSKTTDLGQYIRIEESYSTSTITYAVALVVTGVIFAAIIFGSMASVLSMDDNEINDRDSLNNTRR